jgi:hypothetical protein
MIPNTIERVGPRSPKSRSRKSTPAAPGRHDEGAHLNPATGLAGDYLDHFNQAVMLLELLAATPDCAGNFHAWRPRTYQDYLQASAGQPNDAAIAAYGAAAPQVRARFETLIATMTDVLMATQDVMQSTPTSPAIGMLANRAALWVGRLAVQARAVIDGSDPCCAGVFPGGNAQASAVGCVGP